MLPAFLEAVGGLWDELVAVDTGSVDGTADLLSAAGAKVLERPWDDDFAAARNYGLERASGDFVLVLDADERVGPLLSSEIRGAVEDRRCGAASLLVEDTLPHGHLRCSRLLRMFRNDPGIRYRHAIHEEVGEAVALYLSRSGLARLDLVHPLAHLGYARERATRKNKRERDVRILRSVLAQKPRDLYARYKLLEQARFWSDLALWKEAASETAAVLSKEPPDALACAHFGGELAVLVAEGLYREEPAAALGYLESFAGRLAPSAEYELRRGELREKLGDLPGARGAYEACLGMPRTDNAQFAAVRPRLGLARLALAAGELARAADEGGRALELAPLDPEALLLLAVLRRHEAGRVGLARFAEERRAACGDRPEIAKAVREAARLAGDLA